MGLEIPANVKATLQNGENKAAIDQTRANSVKRPQLRLRKHTKSSRQTVPRLPVGFSRIRNLTRSPLMIAMIDGCNVIKVPAARLPVGFGFLLAHPVATVAPVKLEDFKTHQDPPGISGALVEMRVTYDAFVLNNKAGALYYQVQQVV